MEFQTSIEISVPPEVVFAFISVQANHPRFIRENKESRQLTPGPMAVGARVQNIASFMGMHMKEEFAITEFEPGRKLAKRSLEGSTVETTDTFELERTPSGTRVHLTVTGNPQGLRRLLLRVMTPVMQKSFERILQELKRILESEPSSARSNGAVTANG